MNVFLPLLLSNFCFIHKNVPCSDQKTLPSNQKCWHDRQDDNDNSSRRDVMQGN